MCSEALPHPKAALQSMMMRTPVCTAARTRVWPWLTPRGTSHPALAGPRTPAQLQAGPLCTCQPLPFQGPMPCSAWRGATLPHSAGGCVLGVREPAWQICSLLRLFVLEVSCLHVSASLRSYRQARCAPASPCRSRASCCVLHSMGQTLPHSAGGCVLGVREPAWQICSRPRVCILHSLCLRASASGAVLADLFLSVALRSGGVTLACISVEVQMA